MSPKTLHGKVRGNTIKLDEDLGVPEGQMVEVQVTLVSSGEATLPVDAGLARVYGILGERYESGSADTAARHDEHQP